MTISLGVLISGSGSNLQAICDEIDAGRLDATVDIVISSREGVRGVERAMARNILTVELNAALYEDPSAANSRIRDELVAAGVDYIVMAGYMRKLGREVLDAFPDKVVNLHPALLPAFPGAHAIADALAAGVKVTGVTVHFANEVYDDGPIIAQEPVRVLDDDTEDTLAQRIHETEHELYPRVIGWLAGGRVSIDEHRHVKIRDDLSSCAT